MKRKLFIYFFNAFALIVFISCSNESTIQTSTDDELIATRADEVPFPTFYQIIDDRTVKDAMEDAWVKTKSSASAGNKHERGFYVYYDKKTRIYKIGELVYGERVDQCSEGRIYPGVAKNNLTVCAFFHTHTPLTYCEWGGYKDVGPSPADKSFAESNQLPCIIYDYSDNLPAGHDIHARATKYHCGPIRRPSLPTEQ